MVRSTQVNGCKRRDVRQAEGAVTLGPKRCGARNRCASVTGRRGRAPGVEARPHPCGSRDETCSARRAPPRASAPQGKPRGRRGQADGASEGRLGRRWRGREPGGHMIRRASAPPSLWCLGTKPTEEAVQRVLQMSVAWFHGCYPPRQGIDCCPVSCSQHVSHADGSFTRPLRGLSGVRCKSHAPF